MPKFSFKGKYDLILYLKSLVINIIFNLGSSNLSNIIYIKNQMRIYMFLYLNSLNILKIMKRELKLSQQLLQEFESVGIKSNTINNKNK